MSSSLTPWQMLGLVLISGLLWMNYVRSKDRLRPEPRRRLLLAFVLGIAAFILAAVSYEVIEALGVPPIRMNERPWTAVYCFGIVGPLEEGSKVLLAWLFVFRWREYDEPVDGFVYAASLALGFACAENFYGTSDVGWVRQLAHTVATPFVHVLFSAIWGLGIAHAHFCVSRSSRRVLWQAGSIALAMAVHGLHDFLIFAYQASLATSALALVLWVLLIWRLGLSGNRAARPTV